MPGVKWDHDLGRKSASMAFKRKADLKQNNLNLHKSVLNF
jgi:hypothetical protein